MATKRKMDRDQVGTGDEGEMSPLESVRSMMSKIDLDPWMERASDMLKARPGVTIAAAVGTGFILGLTLFSKLGRIALIGALGVGTELLVQKARASFMEGVKAS